MQTQMTEGRGGHEGQIGGGVAPDATEFPMPLSVYVYIQVLHVAEGVIRLHRVARVVILVHPLLLQTGDLIQRVPACLYRGRQRVEGQGGR